jgi:hypothetical protein
MLPETLSALTRPETSEMSIEAEYLHLDPALRRNADLQVGDDAVRVALHVHRDLRAVRTAREAQPSARRPSVPVTWISSRFQPITRIEPAAFSMSTRPSGAAGCRPRRATGRVPGA